jgi:hypothetical protein
MQPVAGLTPGVTLLAVLALTGCGPADPTVAGCLIAEGSRQSCSESRGLRGDDARLYYLDTCRSAGGMMMDACPTENARGYCEYAVEAPAAGSRMPRPFIETIRREFRYVAPGSLSELAGFGEEPDCGTGTWHAFDPPES